MNPLIKICGITNGEDAQFAAERGANFVGMIFHSPSKRNVNLLEAQKIVRVLKNTKTKPVAVFVDQTAEEIKNVVNILKLEYIQLHGSHSRAAHALLNKEIHRIYVMNVDNGGKVFPDQENGLQFCQQERDFILFDNLTPGSGKCFHWHKFKNIFDFKWFLSGGLTPNNVVEGIKLLHPTGVDVSSGVESFCGVKDKGLIDEFIKRTKSL